MYILNINSRETGECFGAYASFESYAEAVEFGNRHEMSFRAAGQFWTVVWAEAE